MFSSRSSYQQPQVSHGYLDGVLMRQPPQVSIVKPQRIAALYPQPSTMTFTPPILPPNIKGAKRRHAVYLWTPSITKNMFTS